MQRKAVSTAVALGILVLAGCGSNEPDLADPVPVSGTVTLDDQPLANATVYFTPQGENMGGGSTGITDSSGKYELVTRYGEEMKKGAVPGNYKVWISRLVGPDGAPIAADSTTPPADLGAMESLPPSYSDPMLTEQTALVGETGGTFDFTISTRGTRGGGGAMGRMPQ